MKSIASAFLCTAIFAAGAQAAEPPTLTAADQCMIDAYQGIFRTHAQTVDVYEIEIAPIQQRCEEETDSKVEHPDLLEKGLSDWSAGGTRFLFK